MALTGVAWGLFWIPTRYLAGLGVPPAWMSLGVAAIVLLVMLPAVYRHPAALKHITAGGLATALAMSGAFTLYSLALVLTSVVSAVLLFYLSPIWSTLMAWALHGERPRLPRLGAIALGFAGLAVTLGAGENLPIPRNAGDWLALVSGFVWSWGSMRSHAGGAGSSERTLGEVFAYNAMGLAAAIGLLAVLPWSIIGPVPSPAQWQSSAFVLIGLALILVLPSSLVLVWATQRLPAPRVGLLLMTEVVAGSVSAGLLAGEPFGARQIIGALLILAAGVLEVLGRGDPAPTRESPA